MAKNIEQLLKDDAARMGAVTLPLSEIERVQMIVIPPYAKNILDAIENGDPLRTYAFGQREDNNDKVFFEDKQLDVALEALREQNKTEIGERTHYPSRPMLTSLAVRRLVATPTLYVAHYSLTQEDGVIRWKVLKEFGDHVYDAAQCIDRAEGVIKSSARAEALQAPDQPLSEERLATVGARYQDHADRLIKDPTGIATVEGNLLKTVATISGIRTPGDSGLARLDYPSVKLAANLFTIEAYRAIYPHTANTGKK